MSKSGSGLNVNAVEFVPNPGAAVFVPGATAHSVVHSSSTDYDSGIGIPANAKPEESKIDEGGGGGGT